MWTKISLKKVQGWLKLSIIFQQINANQNHSGNLLEWIKLKNKTKQKPATASVDKDMKEQHLDIAGWYIKWLHHTENGLVVTWKVNLYLPYGPSTAFHMKIDSTCPIKDVHTKTHQNFICNSLKMDTTQTSTNRQLDKWIVVSPLHGQLNNTKK